MTGQVDLDALRAAIGAAEWAGWRAPSHDDCIVMEERRIVAECTDPDDAALIVAAVNALPQLLAAVRQSAVREARLRALAEEWDRGSAGRSVAAARLRAVLDEEAD